MRKVKPGIVILSLALVVGACFWFMSPIWFPVPSPDEPFPEGLTHVIAKARKDNATAAAEKRRMKHRETCTQRVEVGRTCQIHGEPLMADAVPIVYAEFRIPMEFTEASKEFFPNSHRVIYVYDDWGRNRQEFDCVAFCGSCRKVAVEWDRQHVDIWTGYAEKPPLI